MNVKIVMREADPRELRAGGEVRQRGKQTAIHDKVSSKIGFAKELDLEKGLYTYVFAIDRRGAFRIVAVNTKTGAELSPSRKYEMKSRNAELRYFFEVP